MKYIVAGFIIFFSMVIQSSVLPLFRVMGYWPDILVALVACYGLYFGASKGGYIGFATGLIQDVVFGFPLGINAISKTVVGFMSGLGEEKINKEFPFISIPLVIVATLVHDFIYLLSYKLTGVQVQVFNSLYQWLAPMVIINGVAAPFIYNIIIRSNEWVFRNFNR
jgi:rod shape-determining protein MreD